MRLGLQPRKLRACDQLVGGAGSFGNAHHSAGYGLDHRDSRITQQGGVTQVHHHIKSVGALSGLSKGAQTIFRVLKLGHQLDLGEPGNLAVSSTTHDEPSLAREAKRHVLTQFAVRISNEDARGQISGHGTWWHVLARPWHRSVL